MSYPAQEPEKIAETPSSISLQTHVDLKRQRTPTEVINIDDDNNDKGTEEPLLKKKKLNSDGINSTNQLAQPNVYSLDLPTALDLHTNPLPDIEDYFNLSAFEQDCDFSKQLEDSSNQ